MRSLLAVAGVLTVLVAPAPAVAREYFTAPGATGATCAAADPCALSAAVSAGQAADTIRLAPGTYGSDASPAVTGGGFGTTANAQMVGTVIGRDRAVVYTGSLRLNANAQDVELRGGGVTIGPAALVTRVAVRQTSGNGFACAVDGGKLLDALCINKGATNTDGTSGALTMYTPNSIVRNVTAVSSTFGITFAENQLQVANVIARGNTAGAGGTDLRAFAPNSGSTFATSAWSTLNMGGAAPPGMKLSPPQFADTIDYRVANAQQPTVDTGTGTGIGTEELDLDGNARQIGAAVDVGAYELVTAAPAVAAAPTTGISDTGATMSATITTNGGFTPFHFDWGTSTAYDRTTSEGYRTGATVSDTVPGPLTGLTPGTTYHYRLVAGPTAGPDQTFTTTGVAPVTPGSTNDGTTPTGSPSTQAPAVTPVQTPPPPTVRKPARPTLRPGSAKTLARLLRSGRTVKVRVACGADPCNVRLRAELRRGKRRLGRVATPARALKLRAAASGRIGLVSSKRLRARARARSGGKLVLVLRATFTPASGAGVTRTSRVTLSRR